MGATQSEWFRRDLLRAHKALGPRAARIFIVTVLIADRNGVVPMDPQAIADAANAHGATIDEVLARTIGQA